MNTLIDSKHAEMIDRLSPIASAARLHDMVEIDEVDLRQLLAFANTVVYDLPKTAEDTQLLQWMWENRGHGFTTDEILSAGSGRQAIRNAMARGIKPL